MVRGAEAKNIVTAKILDTFVGAFVNDKEIRIPVEENGSIVQIKVTLTAAKVNVNPYAEAAMPTKDVASASTTEQATLTEQERKDVANILAELNL